VLQERKLFSQEMSLPLIVIRHKHRNFLQYYFLLICSFSSDTRVTRKHHDNDDQGSQVHFDIVDNLEMRDEEPVDHI
jgi:hypothetical protein